MATRADIAQLAFPEIQTKISDQEKKYPKRNEKIVTRFAPSPTWFVHIGAIFASLTNSLFAHQNNGVFILRIEDTDQKRLVEWSIDQIIKSLQTFSFKIDEWPIGENHSDVGNYGPYIQSHRKTLYHTFVKELIAQGKAYPCRMSSEEIETIRDQQTKQKLVPGIYGNYSVWRHKTPDELVEKMKTDSNFVVRFRSHGDTQKKITFEDLLRWKIQMMDNHNDIPLIKSDGLPTYHLAHIVDDYLMGTTHVIRAEEWLASVPLHIQLFEAFGLQHPIYCHLAPLLKIEDWKKRKLSKRKDPEMDITYLFQHGYDPDVISEYLMTIIDPHFEERQKKNPTLPYQKNQINLEKMNKAGALFDLVKLKNVSNNYLSKLSTQDLYNKWLSRAKQFDTDLVMRMESDPEYVLNALNIERHTEKDPKRFFTYADIREQLTPFFDDLRLELYKEKKIWLPDMFTIDLVRRFVEEYVQILDLSMSVEQWFEQLKTIGKKYGFASNNAEFKEGGYIGKIGDLAMFLRIQLCGSPRTPDLYSVMQVLGKSRIIERLQK